MYTQMYKESFINIYYVIVISIVQSNDEVDHIYNK